MALIPVGRPRTFDKPEELWAKFEEYSEWVEQHPFEVEVTKTKTGAVGSPEVEVRSEKRMRAMTIQGFCIVAGISSATFYNYEREPGFLEIAARIKSMIYEQKFTGAAADMLNANLIARELGLAEKRELSSPDGSMTPVSNINLGALSDEQLRQLSDIAASIQPSTDKG